MRRSTVCVIQLALVAALAGCGESTAPVPTTPGTIRVTTATNGDQLDANGYLVSIDNAPGQSIGINTSLELGAIPAGSHQVELLDIAPSCGVLGGNPITVSVSAGTTSGAAFNVICGASGTLTITTSTGGVGPFTLTYQLAIDGVARGTIGANVHLVVSDLTLGLHSVTLTVPAACTFDLLNATRTSTKSATVLPGQDVAIGFSVVCL